MPTASGQPPRHASSTRPTVPSSPATHGSNSPRKSPARETAPEESPLSESDMGCIRMRPILPAPLWLGGSPSRPLLASGVEEPVRIQPPRSPRSRSTPLRTASHMRGASCHSSITCGRSPRVMRDGSARARSRSSST